MAANKALTLKSALLAGKAGLLQSLQRLTLDPHYVPARLPEGMVVGIWGEAVVRTPDGTVRELKVGEMVRKGYVILTSQNGIVQLQVEGDRLARIPADREVTEAPAAGLQGGEDGSLSEADRVGRVIEVVSPAEFDFNAASNGALPGAGLVNGVNTLGLPTLGVNQVTVDEGAGHAVFTVQLSRASDTPTTLNLTLADGTAQGAGVDYGSTGPSNLEVSLDNGVTWTPATSVTIPAGATTVLVRTPITDDTLNEANETFTLNVTVASGDVNPTQPTGTATITDNGDKQPTIGAINDVVVNEAAGTATFTVTLSEASGQPVTVRYTTADGTATSGLDYSPVAGLLTFAPGETTKTITVPITNDTVYEGPETFFIQLSDPVNAGLPSPTGKGTIMDDGTGPVPPGVTPDDDRPHVASVSSPTVDEGQPLDFTVTLTHPSTTPTVLDVLPKSGTGTLGVDTEPPQVSFDGGKTFTPVTGGTVTVPPNTDTIIVRIPTVNDPDKEPSETITLDVKVPTDTTPTTGTGTINPDPNDAIKVSIAGPAQIDEAAGNASYTVTLSGKSDETVTVRVQTADGTAKAGSDYTAVDQVLTFAPGETSKTVLVPITNDDLFEGKEDYVVALSAPTNATVVTTSASVTTSIADDINKDTGGNNDAPTLAVSSLSLPESAGHAVFSVTLSKVSGVATTVSLALADGTAKGGGVDYGTTGASNLQVSTDGGTTWADATTATFAAGQTSVLVRTPVVIDTIDDANETFTLQATTTSPTGGTANANATGTATLLDVPGLLIDDITVNEGTGTATFTVTLTSAATTPVTVQYASANGTATAGTDYTPVSGTLTFAPGVTTQQISVRIADDLVYEGPENFTINLTSPSSNAVVIDPQGVGTIKDDGGGTVPPGVTPTDDRPHAVINDIIVNEGAGTATFTVTLAGTATTPITLDYSSANGTATAGLDYTAVTGTLTFAPGETSKSITVPILNDAVYEGPETFTINLANPSANVLIDDATGLGTIKDDGTGPVPPGVTPDDDRPLVTINDVAVNEASAKATFTVTLSNASDLPVTVKYSSVNGSAEAGFDYDAVLGSITFAPGELTKTIDVPLHNDTVYEGAETFQIVLTDPINGKVNAAGAGVDATKDGTGIGTITDDGTGPVPPGVTPDNDTPALSINDITVNEGTGTATFTVTMSNAAKMPVTVAYTSADGTAKAGLDYTAVNSTLTFAPGETSKTITVPILNDNVYEGAETFTVNLSAPTNATIADGLGLGTIKDDGGGTVPPGVTPDNDTPVLTVTGQSVQENSVTGHVVFTLALSNPSTTATTVSLALTDGTATGSGVDYGSKGSNNLQVSNDGGATWLDATSATFAPNTTSVLVRTPLVNDLAIEVRESLTLTATTTAGTTSTPSATGTSLILDDDVAPVAVNDTGVTLEDTPITGNVITDPKTGDRDDNNDPLTITSFTVGGTTSPAGTPVVIPGVGTLTIAPDGAYTFTPLPNYDGAVPVATYTVTDGANPVTGTLTLTITPVNDAPIVTPGAVTPLSEEGLAGGLADTFGTTDSTNVVVNTGQVTLRDIEGSPMTVVWGPVTASYTQNGIGISWTGEGTRTLVGRADSGPEILTATIDDTGAYTVTLKGQIDHPAAGEDALQLDFGIVVSDGTDSSPGTVSVLIEDDSPAALVSQTSSVKLQDTNLLITLDTSGSMLTTIDTGALAGQSRLDVAKSAINNLMDAYGEFGNVRVRLVSFANAATDQGGAWLTLAQAKLVLDAISTVNGIPGGITNYDAAITAATAAFGTAGSLPTAQTVAYFLSDGNPNSPRNSEGMDVSEEAAWKAFLNTNNITSYAIGIGDGVGQSRLDPVAWNGTTAGGSEASAVVVTDLAQLSTVLKNTVPIPSGELSAGGTFRAGGQVGADKGNVQSVTVDGVTYTYLTSGAGSGSSNPIAVTGGTSHHTYDATTKTLVVTTSAGGRFFIDLDDGTYEYRVPTSLSGTVQTEVLSYVITDKDGDSQHAQIVVNVGTSTSSVVNSETIPVATHAGTSGADALAGSAAADYLLGGDGNDSLTGLAGNDSVLGGWGSDTLNGGDGNDWLLGGQGNDLLTGGAGTDVFAWTFNDGGAKGTPTVDTITDFNTSLPADGGDIIDLRDLLSGEKTSTLENYLEFSFSGSGASSTTTIHVSSNGEFAGGTYNAANEDQTIVLSGVDLRASLGLGNTATDLDIISKLLTQGKLIVDP